MHYPLSYDKVIYKKKVPKRSVLMKRIWLNLLMVIVFFLLMLYRTTGNPIHELLGVAVLIPIAIHLIWNKGWLTGFWRRKGRVSSLGNLLNILTIICFIAAVITGILESHWLLPDFNLHERAIHRYHRALSFCLFGLAAVHLGFYWQTMWLRIQQLLHKKTFQLSTIRLCQAICLLIFCYGAYASWENNIGTRMLPVHMSGIPRRTYSTLEIFDYGMIFACYVIGSHYLKKLILKIKG